ncbi:hypothetical protein FHS42_007426 [Streptomyces zagrosensis]|uniref:Uncharacterized protein n=1 Tax=Streptomyces zagrosensis TaxID=1042984 RepID=A0A7W9QHF5_9ACTN|nr:hypothetical protein [Streptomyces zagrosensis]
MTLLGLGPADGHRVLVSAQLMQADEDIVRDVIHRFNEIHLAWPWPCSPTHPWPPS